MKLTRPHDSHLCYCTNIHPGEDWAEVNRALTKHLPAVKAQVCPNQSMGVGLRLSAVAANQLIENQNQLRSFKNWLQQQDLYVFTINGFPYGAFHGQAVKERVYQPDWSAIARLSYSKQLATILSELLPDNQHGSISTVPIGFKPEFKNPSRLNDAVLHLLQLAAFLAELEHNTGKRIQYALEPEPACLLETTQDTIEFFRQQLYTEQAVAQLSKHLGSELRNNADISLIKRYLGVCLDTCHAAVMFEEPLAMSRALVNAGIPIHKVQLTAALSVARLNPSIREQLAQYSDDVYLHQTSIRSKPNQQTFYLDLDLALQHAPDDAELRCHFHVPVFAEKLGVLQTTQNELSKLLDAYKLDPVRSHLEVETYTFNLLPQELRLGSVIDNISRELNWVKERLQQ